MLKRFRDFDSFDQVVRIVNNLIWVSIAEDKIQESELSWDTFKDLDLQEAVD